MPEDIREEFRRRRTRQLLIAAPVLIVVLLFAVFEEQVDSSILPVLFFILILGALGFSLWNWRCPSCNSYLGRSMSPRFCPKCGEQLMD